MRIPQHPDIHLTYCLNVHPGESWEEHLAAIQTHAVAIRQQVAPDTDFGLGLRIGRQAAETLQDPAIRTACKEMLAAHHLYAFTINGFPYGTFHGTRVKESVYLPDWRSPERRTYTNMLADILADLLPEGVTGSISTVPGAYRRAVSDPAERETMAVSLGHVAARLDRIKKETGQLIRLGLEPEPDCILETTDELISFIEQDMTRFAIPAICQNYGMLAGRAEAIIRRHIGCCLDTCHMAMQFENPVDSLRKAKAAGIQISKIQISAALTAKDPPVTAAELAAFDDNVYLHQVRIRTSDGHIQRFPDLRPALEQSPPSQPPAGQTPREWRVHCHVPLFFTGTTALGTTASGLTPAFFAQAIEAGIPHWEIETYTLGVLPEALRTRRIDTSIAEEFAWLQQRLPTSPGA